MKPYGEPMTEVPAPPKPDPRITPQTVIGNYPRQDKNITPHRDCDGGAFDFIGRFVMRFIDWLNGVTGANERKPKRKDTNERMTTLEELFEGYEEVDRERGTPHMLI